MNGSATKRPGKPRQGAAATTGLMRDRTQRFMRYRDLARGRTGPKTDREHERSNLLDPEAQSMADGSLRTQDGAGVSGRSPEWTALSQKIQADLGILTGKIKELESLHQKTTLTRFSDISQEEQMVEVVAQEATAIVIRCKKGLDRLARPLPGEHPSEAKVRENARRRLALQLQDLVVKQRSAQKRYLQKMKEKQGGGQRSAVFDFLDREMGAAGGANGADIDTGFNAVQLQRLQQSEVGVDQREKEVMGLMQSINDLMDIMHDLSVLVIDQGTMLDRIEFNVQKVAMTVSGDGLGAVGGKCAARQAALCARRRAQRRPGCRR